MVLGKGVLGGGAAMILSMLVSSPPPGVGIYMVIGDITTMMQLVSDVKSSSENRA